MEEELLSFVTEVITSFTDWDILTFFLMNPDLSFNTEDLRTVLGRRPAEIKESVERLCEKSILDSDEDGMLSLTTDEKINSFLCEFRRASEHREKRLALLSVLLRKRQGMSWR